MSGVNGDMYKKQVPESILVNYFTVESISDFIFKIEKLDGTVIQPKSDGYRNWLDCDGRGS